MVSPYLTRPLRSFEDAKKDREEKEKDRMQMQASTEKQPVADSIRSSKKPCMEFNHSTVFDEEHDIMCNQRSRLNNSLRASLGVL